MGWRGHASTNTHTHTASSKHLLLSLTKGIRVGVKQARWRACPPDLGGRDERETAVLLITALSALVFWSGCSIWLAWCGDKGSHVCVEC